MSTQEKRSLAWGELRHWSARWPNSLSAQDMDGDEMTSMNDKSATNDVSDDERVSAVAVRINGLIGTHIHISLLGSAG